MPGKLVPFVLAITATVAPAGCIVVTDDADSSLEITNRSSYVLTEIRVAAVDAPTWGPDLLGGDVLYPDESLIVALDCGDYDALVVDELGAECVLSNLYLCYDDAEWVITDSALAECDQFAAPRADAGAP